MTFTIVLSEADKPDYRGIILSKAVLINIVENADPKCYNIKIGNDLFQGRKLFLDANKLICEFNV